MSDRLFALNLLAAVSFGLGVGVIAAAAAVGPHLVDVEAPLWSDAAQTAGEAPLRRLRQRSRGGPPPAEVGSRFPSVDGAREVPLAVLAWAIENADALGRSARFGPRIGGDGEVDGVVLVALPPGSLLGELGLEAGDTLLGAEGWDASGAPVPLEAWPEVPPATIGLALERGGAAETLRYRIVGAPTADVASR